MEEESLDEDTGLIDDLGDVGKSEDTENAGESLGSEDVPVASEEFWIFL